MSTRTRWECNHCEGKGIQEKRVEKARPVDRNFLDRIFRPTPTRPEFLRVQEKCRHCGGTGVLMLSLEEVQKLEHEHDEERTRELEKWGFATGRQFLVINPIDQPVRPPRPDLARIRTYRCRKCGYAALQSEFPMRRNTLVGGDQEAYEGYCPKCGHSDPKDLTPPAPKRTVNWDTFGKPRNNVKPFDRLND
jgi:hypothetical protein